MRRLGDPDTALIEQHPDGTLLLGREGERAVEHYSFFAVFQTPQEYRVVHDAKTLGTIPVDSPLAPDLTIIFAGRRWRVLEVHDREKIIEVAPDHAGTPPIFGGDPGEIHETVIRRMRHVLLADIEPPYLDGTAAEVLSSARAAYQRSRLDDVPIQPLSDDHYLLAPWTGTVGTVSLALVLTCLGYRVGPFDGILDVSSTGSHSASLISQLTEIAAGNIDLPDLIRGRAGALIHEKFHPYLGDDLLVADALSRQLDLSAVPGIARSLCSPL